MQPTRSKECKRAPEERQKSRKESKSNRKNKRLRLLGGSYRRVRPAFFLLIIGTRSLKRPFWWNTDRSDEIQGAVLMRGVGWRCFVRFGKKFLNEKWFPWSRLRIITKCVIAPFLRLWMLMMYLDYLHHWIIGSKSIICNSLLNSPPWTLCSWHCVFTWSRGLFVQWEGFIY